MKKINKFLEITKAAASGILGVLSAYFFKKHLNEGGGEELWGTIAIAVVLFIVVSIFNYVIANIIDKCQWIRKKMLGKDFLEGIWMQKIASRSLTEKPIDYHIISILYEKGFYKITGESYNKKGKYIASFQSYSSKYENHILEYPFTVATIENNTEKKIYGTSKLTFSPADRLPDKYIGTVCSNLRKNPIYVIAKKLPKGKCIDLKTSEGRKDFEAFVN